MNSPSPEIPQPILPENVEPWKMVENETASDYLSRQKDRLQTYDLQVFFDFYNQVTKLAAMTTRMEKYPLDTQDVHVSAYFSQLSTVPNESHIKVNSDISYELIRSGNIFSDRMRRIITQSNTTTEEFFKEYLKGKSGTPLQKLVLQIVPKLFNAEVFDRMIKPKLRETMPYDSKQVAEYLKRQNAIQTITSINKFQSILSEGGKVADIRNSAWNTYRYLTHLEDHGYDARIVDTLFILHSTELVFGPKSGLVTNTE